MGKKMDFLECETAWALQVYPGAIRVEAQIFYDCRNYSNILFFTTRAKLHHAVHSKKRYSLETLKKMEETGHPDTLKAIAYRARVSYDKNLALYEKGCCNLGIFPHRS